MIAKIDDLAVPDEFRLIVLIALSCPSQIGTAVKLEWVKAIGKI
jgi:hypothetical protein